MCQSYNEIISEGTIIENKKRKSANMFHDALVPFAERRIISMIKKILLYPKNYREYYTAVSDYQNLFWALVDIDGDRVQEIMIGRAEGAHPNFEPSVLKIINILKYDKERDVVNDVDGDMVYEALAVEEPFVMLDTRILMTRASANYAYTNFWNLRTGEFHEGWLWYPDDPMAGVDSKGHSKVRKQDGTEITGEEGDKMYQMLAAGNELSLEWHEATAEEVNMFFD